MNVNQHRAGNRLSVSITQIGKYTVIIYDQRAYDTAIARYDATGPPVAAVPPERAPTRKVERPPFAKRKRIAAYKWAPTLEMLRQEKKESA